MNRGVQDYAVTVVNPFRLLDSLSPGSSTGINLHLVYLNHNGCVKSDIVTYLGKEQKGKDVLKGLIVKRVSKIEHSLLAFAIAN